jgi:DNA helicase HerA-like ATPase
MDHREQVAAVLFHHGGIGGTKINRGQEESAGPLLRIGGSQRGVLKDVFVRLRDLSMHLVSLGESGFGKTTLIISLLVQVWNAAPSVPWLIIDLKGEYLQHLHWVSGMVVLKPGLRKTEEYVDPKFTDDFDAPYHVTFMPLRIDLLEVSGKVVGDRSGDGVVTRVFTLLKECLASSFRESSELSPLMEKVLLRSLRNAYSAYHGGGGFLDLLLREVEGYGDSEGRSRGRSDVVRSSEALANRIERFRRGYLEDILNRGEGTLTSKLISQRRVIVDLSECVTQGSTEDLRFLLNIIMEKVFEEAAHRGLTRGHDLRHLTVVEEANLLVPEVFHRKTSADVTPVEEMFLVARGYGEGFVLVAQRPTISSFVLSNAGTKVIFRTPFDAKKIGEILGMNEIAQTAITSLQKFEAIVATVEGDIRKVITPKPRNLRPLQLLAVVSRQLDETEKTRSVPPLRQPQTFPQPQPLALTPTPITKTPNLTNRDAVDHSRNLAGDCSSSKVTQHSDDAGGSGVCEEDLSRLLKKGLSSNKFRLFRAIAVSPQLSITVSDAIRVVFQGKKWKYLDAVRSLTNRTYWKNPPLAIENGGELLQLTSYGVAAWKLIQPLLVAVKQKE